MYSDICVHVDLCVLFSEVKCIRVLLRHERDVKAGLR